MKKLTMLMLFAASSVFAQSNNGHIHFQADSTWVNPVTNRTLCFDGTNFRARVVACVKTELRRSGEECVRWGKKTITQPANSTRMVCLEEIGENGLCVEYGMVPYNQSVDRDVDFEDERGRIIRSAVVTVKSCK